MTSKLTIGLITVGLILLFVIIVLMQKKKLSTKIGIIWILPVLLFFIVALMPEFFFNLTSKIGFKTPSNLMIGILFIFLIVVILNLTIVISTMQKKIELLIQEVSILKSNEK